VWIDKACPKYDPKWKPTESQKARAQEMRQQVKGKGVLPSPPKSPKSPRSPRSPQGEGKVASSSA
jgi:hypothetical protein